MAVGVLQAFTGQGRAAGRCTHDEPACHLVASSPHRITGALESKHRVEDVYRDQRLTIGCILRSSSGEGRKRAGLVDADVNDLALGGFLVREQLLAVDRGVGLTVRVVDFRGGEVCVHTEGAGLIRNDRNDALANALVTQQVFEQSRERHRRGDLLLARTLLDDVVELGARKVDLRELGLALR